MPTAEGWPKALWETLLILRRRGVLLAIISKNEEARVREEWPKIFRGQLSLDDFAIHRINWRPKSENMADILSYVNLLAENVVYIDDSPAQRAEIKTAFPNLRVLRGTPITWRHILLWAPEAQVATITSESANRVDMVRAQVVREDQRKSLSHEDFLTSLNVRMTMFRVDSINHQRFPRTLELINKTNQFNTTGKRWQMQECAAAMDAGTAFYAFEVSDTYTDYGLVGVLVVHDINIEQFVMSCRIMGLDAEVAAVAHVANTIADTGADRVTGLIVETDRNVPCRNIFSRCGFDRSTREWIRPTLTRAKIPAHIEIRTNETAPASSSRVTTT